MRAVASRRLARGHVPSRPLGRLCVHVEEGDVASGGEASDQSVLGGELGPVVRGDGVIGRRVRKGPRQWVVQYVARGYRRVYATIDDAVRAMATSAVGAADTSESRSSSGRRRAPEVRCARAC